MSEPTKGPLKAFEIIDVGKHAKGVLVISGKRDVAIFMDDEAIKDGRHEALANARLFVAAGAMMEALETMVEELDDPGRKKPIFEYDEFAHAWKPNNNYETVQLSLPLRKMARAALALAKGSAT